MRTYRDTEAHKRVMPRLMNWCDEASAAHWEQAHPDLPGVSEALVRIKELGRVSKVRAPSPGHAAKLAVPGGRAPVVLRTFEVDPASRAAE